MNQIFSLDSMLIAETRMGVESNTTSPSVFGTVENVMNKAKSSEKSSNESDTARLSQGK